jgi:hypothetical protein
MAVTGREFPAVTKSIIFRDVTPCSLFSCNRRFEGTYRIPLQGRRNNFCKNQQVSRWQALLSPVQGVLPTFYKCKIKEPHKEEAKARYGLERHIRRRTLNSNNSPRMDQISPQLLQAGGK